MCVDPVYWIQWMSEGSEGELEIGNYLKALDYFKDMNKEIEVLVIFIKWEHLFWLVYCRSQDLVQNCSPNQFKEW